MASVKKYETAKGYAWRVQYRSPDGKSRTKQGFRTKTEAQAWADKNAVNTREGSWIDPALGVMSRDVVESVEGYAANRRVVSVVVVEVEPAGQRQASFGL